MAAGVLTVPRLFLGEALKRLRAESRKTLDETAAAIGKSRARLINVLDGKGTLTVDELARLLDFLGARASQKPGLLALSWTVYLAGAVAGALLLHAIAYPLIVPAFLLLIARTGVLLVGHGPPPSRRGGSTPCDRQARAATLASTV